MIRENDPLSFVVPRGRCLRRAFHRRFVGIIRFMVPKSVSTPESETDRHGARVLFHVRVHMPPLPHSPPLPPFSYVGTRIMP